MFKILYIIIFAIGTLSVTAEKFKIGSVIRDAEIENILHSYLDPIMDVAGLRSKDLKIFIVVDPHLNAFATFDTTIFFTTGTLLKSTGASEIIGVGAHEIGHLKGNHLVRHEEAVSNSNKTALLGAAAGVLLGMLTKNYNVSMAGVMGGMGAGLQSLLKYSQGEESTADSAALQYLKKLAWPSTGFLVFMQKLQNQELLSEKLQDPYIRTHPISRHRVDTIRNFTKNYHSFNALPKKFEADFQRMQLKLEAFLSAPSFILKKYNGSSLNDVYAQAIAYHIQGDVKKSLFLINQVLQNDSTDPYLWELKGQISLEAGQYQEAINAYEVAMKYAPDQILIMYGLVHAMLSAENNSYLNKVIQILDKSLKINSNDFQAYHFLSIAEGRLGNMGKMALSLAKEAALQNQWDRAAEQADRARREFEKNKQKILYMQADDLYQTAKLKVESGVDLPT